MRADERRLVVIGMHRHNRLGDDRPGIDLGADEMHRAAGKPHPGGERLTLRVQSRKSRQQRGVDIDEPVAPSIDKAGVENAHEPGQRHQLNAGARKAVVRPRRRSAPGRVRDRAMRDAGARRAFEAAPRRPGC